MDPEASLDWAAEFGRSAPLLVDIGSGLGESTAQAAADRPDWNVLSVEVYIPGLAALMAQVEQRGLENVRAVEYPAILATSSLNDTRVEVGEPLKWVTRLRATVTSDQRERPIVLRTEMVAGHGGRSGRYDAWRQWAAEEAFVLDGLGATELRPGAGPASSAADAPA